MKMDHMGRPLDAGDLLKKAAKIKDWIGERPIRSVGSFKSVLERFYASRPQFPDSRAAEICAVIILSGISDIDDLIECWKSIGGSGDFDIFRMAVEDRMADVLEGILPGISELEELLGYWSFSPGKAGAAVDCRMSRIVEDMLPAIRDIDGIIDIWLKVPPGSAAASKVERRARDIVCIATYEASDLASGLEKINGFCRDNDEPLDNGLSRIFLSRIVEMLGDKEWSRRSGGRISREEFLRRNRGKK